MIVVDSGMRVRQRPGVCLTSGSQPNATGAFTFLSAPVFISAKYGVAAVLLYTRKDAEFCGRQGEQLSCRFPIGNKPGTWTARLFVCVRFQLFTGAKIKRVVRGFSFSGRGHIPIHGRKPFVKTCERGSRGYMRSIQS